MEFGLALMALLVVGYALVAKRLARYSISSALAFVVIGVLLSEDFLGILVLEPEAESVKLLAELTLALVLFGDASSVDLHALRRDAGPVVRLLVPGLLLTIAFGTVLALGLFPGITLGVALLIGALAGADGCRAGPAGHHGRTGAAADPADPQRRERAERRDRDALRAAGAGARHGRRDRLRTLAPERPAGGRSSVWSWASSSARSVAGSSWLPIDASWPTGGPASSPSWRSRSAHTWSRWQWAATGSSRRSWAGSRSGSRPIDARRDSVAFTEAQGSLLAIILWTLFGVTVGGSLIAGGLDGAAIALRHPQPDGHPHGARGPRARWAPGSSLRPWPSSAGSAPVGWRRSCS